jgi:hypothetical protein
MSQAEQPPTSDAEHWPEHCPEYLPPDVWERALELRDSLATPKAEREALLPLIAPERVPAWQRRAKLGTPWPDMAKTWRSLAKRGIRDRTSWRLLLELFATSAPGAGFDAELRAALARVNGTGDKDAKPGLLDKIAEHAGALAELLEELARLQHHHGLNLPLELTSTLSLLERAGYQDPPSPIGPLQSEAEEAIAAVPLPAVLDALTEAAEVCKAAPTMPHQAYATTRKAGLITEWVRFIEVSFRRYYAEQIHPHGLTFTDTELARTGSAVLDQTVTRDAIKAARKRAPNDPE